MVVLSGCLTGRPGKHTPVLSFLLIEKKKKILTVYSQLISTLDIKARVLNGLTLYSPDLLLSTDTSGYLSFWCLRTYTRIRRLRIHDHSFLTYTITDNTFFSGGKEGGGPKNVCGLGCSLKSCDLARLLDGKEEEHGQVVEHGSPSSTLWKVRVQADKLAVCLMRRGKPSLEIWDLGAQG